MKPKEQEMNYSDALRFMIKELIQANKNHDVNGIDPKTEYPQLPTSDEFMGFLKDNSRTLSLFNIESGNYTQGKLLLRVVDPIRGQLPLFFFCGRTINDKKKYIWDIS